MRRAARPTWKWRRLLAFVCACVPVCLWAGERPNILFILVDDLSPQAVGWVENAPVQTPHLDRLAAAGTQFTNAYNMGSWTPAVCLAARTMLNSGRSLWRARAEVRPPDPVEPAGEQTAPAPLWPELLAAAGYRTWLSGKWHVPVDPETVFDEVRHVRPGMPPDSFPENRPEAYSRPKEGVTEGWSPSDRAMGGFWSGGRHWSEVVADDAEFFLARAAAGEAPFFLYLGFNAPHDPRQSPESYLARYPLEAIPLPENFLPAYPDREAIGSGESLRDEKLAPFPRTEQAVRVHRREYYAMISHLDTQIGRVLAALKQGGQAGNTVVVFASDQGLACGRHGLMGKQNMYEHSMKAPLVFAGAGIPSGERREALVYLQDLMPTTLELAGVARPDFVEFESLVPLLADADRPGPHAVIYGAYTDRQRMVREGSWKLIAYPGARRLRLFALGADPHEMHDLAGKAESAPVLRSLFGTLLSQQARWGDPLDLGAAFPELTTP